MNILIVYGTTEGQTRKIADFLKEETQQLGHTVTMADATEHPHAPGDFQLVIAGASIHAGHYQSALEHYVQQYVNQLNVIPSAFFSVSLTAAGDDHESWAELEKITQGFLEHTGWKPANVTQVAGALKYTQYNFFKKFIMRLISSKAGGSTDTSKDTEYTDWEKVRSFLIKVLKEAKALQTAAAR